MDQQIKCCFALLPFVVFFVVFVLLKDSGEGKP